MAIAGALGLVLVMVPIPRVDFLQSAVGATVALPPADQATPEQLSEVQAATDVPLGEDRVQAGGDDVAEFSLMALVFDSPVQDPVMVRVKDHAGAWGAWRELEVADDEGPDNPTNHGTEPFWVGTGQAYEVNLGSADSTDAKVVLVRNELRRTLTVAEPVAGAESAPFAVNSRASWGARPARAVKYGSTIKKGIVHHTVNGNDYSEAQVPAMLRSIQAYHMDGRGWDDIGYNFVVDRFGGLWEAREGGIDKPVVGAHASGFNTDTVGVSVLGDYASVGPSAAAIESVSRIIGWKLFLGGNDPLGSGTYTSGGSPKYPAGTVVNIPNVVGHGDVGMTDCPGSIRNHLPQIRQRAQEWTNWSRQLSGPAGNLDRLVDGGSSVVAEGWTTDFDAPGPIKVQLRTNGKTATATASIPRPDVKAVHPGYPLSTGFRAIAPDVAPGLQDACVTAINEGGGKDKSLGCRQVRIADPSGNSPDGRIDTLSLGAGSVRIGGWLKDRDGGASSRVTLTIDGVSRSSTNSGRGRYGFALAGLAAGSRQVCVVVKNAGAGVDTRIDCRQVNIPGGSPLGTLDGVHQEGAYVRLWGWALDPETVAPLSVHIVYDLRQVWPVTAGDSRPDVGAAQPGYGNNHGYHFEIRQMAQGKHTICAVAINAGAGSNRVLGCRDVIVK